VKYKPLPSQQELQHLFDYDPETGLFYWKNPTHYLLKKGAEAGYRDNGYRSVNIDGSSWKLHRLVWMFVYGEDPGQMEIDHINGVKNDNRISNLRLATKRQNQHNQKHAKGFSFHKGRQKWQAKIKINGKDTYLGQFDCPLLAHLCYQDARREHFGDFAPT
jgi:hypothetical protein